MFCLLVENKSINMPFLKYANVCVMATLYIQAPLLVDFEEKKTNH
jgi:hypothetical protein